MKKTFLICALPRSRTAWLANFLSYGPSFCFHEPFAQYTPMELPKVFGEVAQENVGISDSLVAVFIEDLLKLFPGSKLVLVRRPVEEVVTRLIDLGLPATDFILQLNAQLDFIEREFAPLVIDYHNFNAVGIWEYVLPEVPLNRLRLSQLEDFNITVPIEKTWKKGHRFIHKLQELMR